MERKPIGDGEGEAKPSQMPASDGRARAGRLEGLRDDQLLGWAWDGPGGSRKARLLIGSDIGLRLEATADEEREDVRAAGFGDGRAGFRIPLRDLAGAMLVSCRWADTGEHLDGSPLALPRAFAPSAQDARTRRTGHLEGRKDRSLVGWAWDLDHPDRRARLIVRSDAGHGFELLADLYRADVQAAGGGDGHVGFRLPLRRMAGASIVSLRWADTGAHLIGSPLALKGGTKTAGAPGTIAVDGPGWVLRVDPVTPASRVISGFFADLQDLGRHDLLALEQDGRVVGRARACRFHPSSPGDQMHGFSFLLAAPLPPGPCVIRDGAEGRVLAAFEAPA